MKTRLCERCWKEFETNIPNKRFCCQKCNEQARNKRDLEPREKQCKYCGGIFMGSRHDKVCDKCMRQLKSKAWKTLWNNISKEDYNKRAKNSSECLKNTWANLSEEEKEKRNAKRVNSWRITWDNLTEQEKQNKLSKLQGWLKTYIENETEEQKNNRITKQVSTRKETYTNMDEDQKKEWHKKSWEGYKKRLDSLTDKEYEDYVQIHIDAMRNSAQDRFKKTWYMYPCQYPHVRASAQTYSKTNQEIQKMFKEKYWLELKEEFSLCQYSCDFIIWNTLIEVNQYPYHNTLFNPKWKKPKDPNYHYDKAKLAIENWYRCIMVWDWDNIDKIALMLKDRQNIYARKCNVKIINDKECNNFFEQYHLQWWTKHNKDNIYIWLYYNGELVECMSFGKPRYNKNYEWELLRLCSHNKYNIIWGASKIFSFFIKEINPKNIISYCDMSKFSWSVYKELWFDLLRQNSPSKHRRWTWNKLYKWPKHITDNLLRQKWFDKLLWQYFWEYWKWTDNEELMIKAWFVSIYDAGQATYIFLNTNT